VVGHLSRRFGFQPCLTDPAIKMAIKRQSLTKFYRRLVDHLPILPSNRAELASIEHQISAISVTVDEEKAAALVTFISSRYLKFGESVPTVAFQVL
jgi:hypothetical protein